MPETTVRRPTIPGSEIFVSRELPRDELRRRISPSLELHTVAPEIVEGIDPLTYEVVRHRLWAITEQMGGTLKRMSGSPVVTEANDFNFSLCDELGDQVQVGLYNTLLVGSMDMAIFWTLEHRSENPGIADGDMFLCNDPWIGSGLHQSDAAVMSPIFHEGKLFAWTTSVLHQLDVGGPAAGGYSPRAKDVFGESAPTPPLKCVRDGILQRDVADAWTRRSRLPVLMGLDLRASVAANVTAKDHILRLIAKYGADIVKAVMKRMMDDAEQRLSDRLSSIADGAWSTDGYIEQSGEGDRRLHRIAVTMTKAGGRLTFDFTGTDPQAGMINCPFPGLRAGVMYTLMPILAGSMPWAPGGLMRCIDIVSEPGTLNDAIFPAAVSKAPVGPSWLTGNLVAECLARMLEVDPETRRDVQSMCAGSRDSCRISGLDARTGSPRPFVTGVLDAMSNGYGAQVDSDGVDTAGLFMIPQGRSPDAEMTEYLYPQLLLWRREETDSGGPGRMRGGLSASVCLVPYGNQGPADLVFSGSGKATSANVGLAGGYPGNSQRDLVVRGPQVAELFAAGRIPSTLDELGGEIDLMACEVEATLGERDVVFMHWQGGGGYGDPTHRDPDAVARDVADFAVSPDAAESVYGVVLSPDGRPDEERTSERRRRIREERVTRSTIPARAARASHDDVPLGPGAHLIDENLARVEDAGGQWVGCRHCGTLLTPATADFRAFLPRFEGPPETGGPHIGSRPREYVDAEVVFRQLACSSCGTALLSVVVPDDHPLSQDAFDPRHAFVGDPHAPHGPALQEH